MNEGTINVIRNKGYIGMIINFEVFIDNQFVGILKNNTNINVPVSLGNHMVSIKTADKQIDQPVTLSNEQKNIFIECKCKMGLIVGRPTITNIYYR